jgi:hypothetical protein
MKIIYIFSVMGLLSFCSCKKKPLTTESSSVKDTLIAEKGKSDTAKADVLTSHEIDLSPVRLDIPHFDDPEANAFVIKIKKYFEEMAEATQKGDSDKVLKLQLQAVDIDTEFQKVKNKLDAKQQKQLSDWYIKLVDAASK